MGPRSAGHVRPPVAAALALALLLAVPGAALAGDPQLWEDPRTHQVYTEPGDGRVPLELGEGKHEVRVGSKAVKLVFGGVHYLGFVYRDPEGGDSTAKFESRRNYLQVKAYFNEKDCMRVTLDTYQETEATDAKSYGSWNVRLKYAYLWLAEVLPHTGVELGQVHRPWIDFEEHHGWWYRSISKTFVESADGAHLINSADLGVNFRTKLDHFSSEIALVNGEGYHGENAGQGLSLEARVTWHVLGTGRKHVQPTRDRYLDVSAFGVRSDDDEERSDVPQGTDFTMAGIHVAWNTPRFLLAGMIVTADNGKYGKYDGDGFSVNLEIRPTARWAILARYDDWDQSAAAANHGGDRTNAILGVAWRYNDFVRFIANLERVDYDEGDPENAGEADENRLYLTAEVHW